MSDNEASEGEEYVVEKILEAKGKGKSTLYLVKWQGYPESENTWEPIENLDGCEDALKEFNDKKKRTSTSTPSGRGGPASRTKRASPDDTDDDMPLTGTGKKPKKGGDKATKNAVERGVRAEKIVGATRIDEELHFLVQFKGGEEELVQNKMARERFPQLVIDFYEARVVFSTPSAEKENK